MLFSTYSAFVSPPTAARHMPLPLHSLVASLCPSSLSSVSNPKLNQLHSQTTERLQAVLATIKPKFQCHDDGKRTLSLELNSITTDKDCSHEMSPDSVAKQHHSLQIKE